MGSPPPPYTHLNHQSAYSKHTRSWTESQTPLPIALSKLRWWEIFSVCGPTARVPLCIWNCGQFLYGNPLRARPIDGHKILQMTNSENVRCPCSGRERLMALHRMRRDEGETNTGRRRSALFFIFFPRDKTVSDERFTFGDKRGVSELTPQGIECGLMIQLFWAPRNTNVTAMCCHSRESLNPGVHGCISGKGSPCPTALCCCLAAIDK